MFLTDLADKLRAYTAPDGKRLNVIEIGGWKTRGYAAEYGWQLDAVNGVLWHHTATASARYQTTGAPTLNMCINGRSDLPGPLAHIVFGRNAEVYVIAAGWANHAGIGDFPGVPTNRGNEFLIGIEMESSGVAPADWTQAQLEYMPVLGAALERGYGTVILTSCKSHTASTQAPHKERLTHRSSTWILSETTSISYLLAVQLPLADKETGSTWLPKPSWNRLFSILAVLSGVTAPLLKWFRYRTRCSGPTFVW